MDAWWPAAHPAIGTDLHNFVAQYSSVYSQKLLSAWNQVRPRPPIFLPLYDGPGYVYSAIAPNLINGDGFWISPSEVTAEVQRIIAVAPGTPMIVGDYSSANPDSPMAGSPCSSAPTDCYSTQAARGAGMVSFWQNTLHLTDVNGRHTVVGLEHWGLYDQENDSTDLGLVTADHDNPYDGSADTSNGEPGQLWRCDHADRRLFERRNLRPLEGRIRGTERGRKTVGERVSGGWAVIGEVVSIAVSL